MSSKCNTFVNIIRTEFNVELVTLNKYNAPDHSLDGNKLSYLIMKRIKRKWICHLTQVISKFLNSTKRRQQKFRNIAVIPKSFVHDSSQKKSLSKIVLLLFRLRWSGKKQKRTYTPAWPRMTTYIQSPSSQDERTHEYIKKTENFRKK